VSTLSDRDVGSPDRLRSTLGREAERFQLAPVTISPQPATVLHARVVAGTGGGPEKTILRSARYASRVELDMSALYLHPRGDAGIETIQQRADALECQLLTIGERGAIDPGTIRHTLRVCREQNVTVWHAHDYKTDLLGLLLRRWHKMKLVTTLHGYTWDTWRTQLYYRIDSSILRHYDHVIAVSPQLADHARRCGVPADKLSYIPNGIRLEEAHSQTTREVVRDAWGLPQEAEVIGVVARHSVEKGVDRAIRVFSQLSTDRENLRLMLIGDGPERATLERLAAELGVADRVVFCGWQKRPTDFYPAMDLLLLPSYTEGLPNVVLEAMANRVAIAATRVGAVPDVLDAGDCGVLLEDDEVAWPDAIATFMANHLLRQRFVRRAERRVAERFTFDRRMRDVFAVYDGLLGTGYAARLDSHEPILRQAA